MRQFALACAVMFGLLTGCATPTSAAAKRISLAITNVTVIDPETRRVLPSRSVYIDGDRIVAVRPSASRPAYYAATVVDGAGRYMIPGLMDMHAHLFLPDPAELPLKLLLANGVTGIREMSSDCWAIAGARRGCVAEYRGLQARIRSGAIPGPELLQLTSTMVMGPASSKLPPGVEPFVTPRTAEQGRALARHLKSRGVDLVKTHDSIPVAAFDALLSEARLLGLAVVGHVPFGAGSLPAAERGYRSIEHARDLLYDCSRYGPRFRKQTSDFADGKDGAAKPANAERLSRTVAEFDRPACTAFLARLAGTGVYYVPTHVTREMEARAGEPAYRYDPLRRYILPARNKNWDADLEATAAVPAAEAAALRRFFDHGLAVTGLAHKAGVPIMAGTDTSDTMIVPGFSLHRELDLLVRAGLSPMDALRAATSVPAAYLGRTAALGGIAPGKQADLVLLRADPLRDIANSRSIEAVITDGRLHDRARLDGWLSDVESAVASAPAVAAQVQ